MIRVCKILFLIVAILLTLITVTFAQVGIGARALGMGGAFTAVAEDEGAAYWNPASCAGQTGISIVPSFSTYIKSNIGRDEVSDVKNIEDIGNKRLSLDGAYFSNTLLNFSIKGVGIGIFGEGYGTVSYKGENLALVSNVIKAAQEAQKPSPDTSKIQEYLKDINDGDVGGLWLNGNGYGIGEIFLTYAQNFKTLTGLNNFKVGCNIKILSGKMFESDLASEFKVIDKGIDNLPPSIPIIIIPTNKGYLFEGNGTGIGIDIGALGTLGRPILGSNMKVGINIRNLISSIRFKGTRKELTVDDGSVPSEDKIIKGVAVDESRTLSLDKHIRIGGAIKPPSINALIAMDIDANLDSNKIATHLGIEKKLAIVILRLGMFNNPDVGGGTVLTLGLGLPLGPVKFDVAVGSSDRFDKSFMGALSLGLKF